MTNPHRRDGDGRPHSVPRAAVDAFSRDGVVRLEGAFGVEWVDTLAAGVERNLRAPGPMATDYIEDGEEGRFFGDYCNWTRIPEFRSFVLESPAAEIAAGVTGSSSVQFYHEHVLIKEPGTSRRTPWHHDLPYFNVEGTKTLAIWLALDPVERSVCPEFVAGSHRWGRLFYPRMFGDFSDYDYEGRGYETVPDIDGRRADYRILAWDLEPGGRAPVQLPHAARGAGEQVAPPPPGVRQPLARGRRAVLSAARHHLAALSGHRSRPRRPYARGLVPSGLAVASSGAAGRRPRTRVSPDGKPGPTPRECASPGRHGHRCPDGMPVQGSSKGTSASSKSATFRVTTVKTWTRAVAAMNRFG